ncbi:MAG: histidine--tRNA ligase [Sneathiellaceae bacterium]
MASLQPVRGTHDLLPDDFARHAAVIDAARAVSSRYGYREVAPPIFEFTEVFARTMGETSDVVSKEMYSFEDRGGEGITLRPEFTAGICRGVISNGLAQALPLRVFANGPVFRYERPQKGRQRQFHQIDIELIGAPEPRADIEVIAIAWDILNRLGVAGVCRLEVNSLGDPESRAAYREALLGYLEPYRGELSPDSQARLGRNPLRILDSKVERDREIVADAPQFGSFLGKEATAFWDEVQDGLTVLGIPFAVNPRLVRGLDYYTHTAFEFITEALGAQGAVIAGGRYDGLIEMLGGPSTPGIGWGGGIERLAMLADRAATLDRPVALVPLGAEAERRTLALAHALRQAGLSVDEAFKGNLSRRLKRANKVGARFAVLLGEDEIAAGRATVRDLDSGAQAEIAFDDLSAHLTAQLAAAGRAPAGTV